MVPSEVFNEYGAFLRFPGNLLRFAISTFRTQRNSFFVKIVNPLMPGGNKKVTHT